MNLRVLRKNQLLNYSDSKNTDGDDTFTSGLLQLNGHDRFSKRNSTYFRKVQNYEHHTHVPRVAADMENIVINSSSITTLKVASITDKILTNEIGQLKEDIEAARKNDFGRKLFEAFASEYGNSYLNENSETAKLLKVIKIKDKQLTEAKKTVVEKQTLAEAKQAEIKRMTNVAQRQNVISELTAPLNRNQKDIMMDLLESVQTGKLRSQFDKYLPAVIDGNAPEKKAKLTEGKEHTGNREETKSHDNVSDDSNYNVVDIRRLAGLN